MRPRIVPALLGIRYGGTIPTFYESIRGLLGLGPLPPKPFLLEGDVLEIECGNPYATPYADFIMRLMVFQQFFEGKETEENWKARSEKCQELVKIADACHSPPEFAKQLRPLIDGILKCATSERTSLSNDACKAIQAITAALGHCIHPMLDIILPPLIQLCGFTKGISQKTGNETVAAIIRHATYSPRLLHHVTAACEDKKSPPRIFAAAWLNTIITQYTRSLDQPQTLDAIDKYITLGLNDAQAKVRENMRATYWAYAATWPTRAEGILSRLTNHASKALLDDVHNPKKMVTEAPVKKSSSIAAIRTQALKKKLEEDAATAASAATTTAVELAGQPNQGQDDAVTEALTAAMVATDIAAPDFATFNLGAAATVAPDMAISQSRDAPFMAPQPARQPRIRVMATHHTASLTSMPATRSGVSTTASQITQLPDFAPFIPAEGSRVLRTALKKRSGKTKKIISEEELKDLMTRPLEGQDEANKENNLSKIITDNRSWSKKEIVEANRKDISPHKKEPVEARAKIAQAIAGIRGGTLDELGYRRLQGLIKEHDGIFKDESTYDFLVFALFEALERSHVTTVATITTDSTNTNTTLEDGQSTNQFRVLVLIRLMMKHNPKYISAYYARGMAALINARGNFESRSHIVSGIEQTAEDIVAATVRPTDIIDVVVDNLRFQNTDKAGIRSTVLGLQVLTSLVTRLQTLNVTLSVPMEQTMASTALTLLRSRDMIIKRAAVAYAVKLHEIIRPEDRFYTLVAAGIEEIKALIEYYVIAEQAKGE